jgi:hypothetical protein
MQNNSFDCGLYVCRYAVGLINLISDSLTIADLEEGLASKITNSGLFDFNGDDIFRMRSELFDLLGYVTDVYRNHRLPHQPSSRLGRETTNSDDDDDVMSIPSCNHDRASTTDHLEDSASEWECSDNSSVNDEDDDVLVADSTGENSHSRNARHPTHFFPRSGIFFSIPEFFFPIQHEKISDP